MHKYEKFLLKIFISKLVAHVFMNSFYNVVNTVRHFWLRVWLGRILPTTTMFTETPVKMLTINHSRERDYLFIFCDFFPCGIIIHLLGFYSWTKKIKQNSQNSFTKLPFFDNVCEGLSHTCKIILYAMVQLDDIFRCLWLIIKVGKG